MSKKAWTEIELPPSRARRNTEYFLKFLAKPENREIFVDHFVVLLEQDLRRGTSEGSDLIMDLWGKSPYRNGARPSNPNQADSPESKEHLTL